MIVTKCLVGFTTHHALITVDDRDCITVFKYIEKFGRCDWEQFHTREQHLAAEYILEPISPIQFYVKVNDD